MKACDAATDGRAVRSPHVRAPAPATGGAANSCDCGRTDEAIQPFRSRHLRRLSYHHPVARPCGTTHRLRLARRHHLRCLADSERHACPSREAQSAAPRVRGTVRSRPRPSTGSATSPSARTGLCPGTQTRSERTRLQTPGGQHRPAIRPTAALAGVAWVGGWRLGAMAWVPLSGVLARGGQGLRFGYAGASRAGQARPWRVPSASRSPG